MNCVKGRDDLIDAKFIPRSNIEYGKIKLNGNEFQAYKNNTGMVRSKIGGLYVY